MSDSDCCEPGTCRSPRLRLGAVLLAAGEGQRLGYRAKGLLEVAGQTLLARNLQLLHSAGVDEVVVVTGHYRDELAPVLSAMMAELDELVITEVMQSGESHSQADSLRLAIEGFTGELDATLVMPVDMPSLTRADIIALIGAYKHAPETIEFVGPQVAGWPGNPVLFNQRIAGCIARGEGEFGSGAWRHASPDWALEWQTDNAHYVADIDTPEDLARWADAISRWADKI